MQSKKGQKVLSGLIFAVLIFAVFSIAFITEPEKVIERTNRGMEAISGMVVLEDILDNVAGEEREMVLRAEDDNFYLIRKKGDEWYYGDTAVRVAVENMNSVFDYYLVSEVPDYVEVSLGAPFESFGITGMVTGMRGVTGYGIICYSADGQIRLPTCPGTKTPHVKIETRSDGVKIKTVYYKDKDPEKSWAPKNDQSNFRAGNLPELPKKETEKFYYRTKKGDFVEIEGAANKADASRKAAEELGSQVDIYTGTQKKREETRVPTGKEALSGDVYIFQIEKEGKRENVRITVGAGGDAETVARNRASYEGGYVVEDSVQRPEYTVTVQGQKFTDVKSNSEKQAIEKIKEELRKGGVDEQTLNKLEMSVEQEPIKMPGVKEPPKKFEYKKILGKDAVVGPDYFKFVKTKEEGNLEVTKLNKELIIKKHGESAKEDAKKNGLNLLKEEDENGLNYARDKEGKIHYFNQVKGEYKEVDDPTYRTYEKIGKDKDIQVIRTYKTEDSTQAKVEVKKDGETASVDEETVNQIKNAEGKGLKVEITSTTDWIPSDATHMKDGKYYKCKGSWCYPIITTGPAISDSDTRVGWGGMEELPGEQVMEFRDKNGNLVAETTLSRGYSLQSGIKTNEQFRTAYFYDGEEISKEKYEKLKKEKKDVKEERELQIFKRTQETDKGDLKSLTTYEFNVKFDKDKNPIVVYEGVKVNAKGEIEEFVYGEGDNEVVLKKDGTYKDGNKKLESKAKTALKQHKSRRFFSTAEFVMTEFSGLGYFATWFMDDETLDAWRESVDKVFATMYLGTEYWASAICSSNIERDQKGVAYVDTRTGLASVAAHIEATRSERIEIPENYTESNRTVNDRSQYLYKITFNVKNGDWENDPRALEGLEFNVYLYGSRTAKLLKQNKKLGKGESFGKIRSDAVVQYSRLYYNKICIKFKKVPHFWSLDDEELCNTIQGPPGKAQRVSTGGESGYQETAQGEADGEFLQI